MDDDNIEKKFLQIQIAKNRKERWKEAVSDGLDYRSMTHLIVTAVENELEDETIGGGPDIELTSIHDRFDAIGNQLQDIEDTVDETFILVRDERQDAVLDLAATILDLIPEIPEDERDSLMEADADPDRYDDPLRVVRASGSVRALAKHLTTPPEEHRPFEVKQAIEVAEKEMSTVRMEDARPGDEDSDKRVYRVED